MADVLLVHSGLDPACVGMVLEIGTDVWAYWLGGCWRQIRGKTAVQVEQQHKFAAITQRNTNK